MLKSPRPTRRRHGKGGGDLSARDVTYLFRFREGDFGFGGHGQKVLETVDDGVRDRGNGRVPDRKAHGSHVAHAVDELPADVVIGDVQHVRVEHGARIVDWWDNKTPEHAC